MNDELQRFIDSLADQVLILEPGFRVMRANEALLQALGCSSDAVVGRYCYEISHGRSKPCSPPNGACPALDVWNGETMSRSIHVRTAADGSRRYIEVVASALTGLESESKEASGVRRVVEVVRDVTAQKQVSAKLVQRNRELAALLSMARALTRSLELETVLAEALRQAATVVGADAGAIYLFDRSKDRLELAAHKGLMEEFAQSLGHHVQNRGITTQSDQADGSVVFDRVSSALAEQFTPTSEVPLSSMASRPLRVAGRLVGVLTLLTREIRTFTPAETASLTALARGIAIGYRERATF